MYVSKCCTPIINTTYPQVMPNAEYSRFFAMPFPFTLISLHTLWATTVISNLPLWSGAHYYAK